MCYPCLITDVILNEFYSYTGKNTGDALLKNCQFLFVLQVKILHKIIYLNIKVCAHSKIIYSFLKCVWLYIFLWGESKAFIMLSRKPVIQKKEVVNHMFVWWFVLVQKNCFSSLCSQNAHGPYHSWTDCNLN